MEEEQKDISSENKEEKIGDGGQEEDKDMPEKTEDKAGAGEILESDARKEAKEQAERPAAESGKAKEGFDFGRLLFGLLAISFGLFLLGKNMGYIPADAYIDVFRFWPVLIVAAGLSLLDTRRPFSFVLALFVFAAVAVMVGTAIKDAVLTGDKGGRDFPLRMDEHIEWDDYGPIRGPIRGI